MAINGKGIQLVDLFVWKWAYSNARYLHTTRVFSSHLTFSPVLQILKVSCRRHTHWRVSSLKFIIPVYRRRCRDRFFARWKFCRHRGPPSVSLSFSWRNFRAKTIPYFFFPIAANKRLLIGSANMQHLLDYVGSDSAYLKMKFKNRSL